MRKLLTILILLTIFGCETPQKKKETKPASVIEEPIEEVIVEEKVEKVDNTLVSLKRKPCSGDCPVFEVTITKDSILTYNGIDYTNIEGIHTVKLTAEQYGKISQILEDSKFSELKNRYAKSGTKDFAESVITHQGKDVTVRLWKDSPKRLTAIYVFIEDILYNQKYLQ